MAEKKVTKRKNDEPHPDEIEILRRLLATPPQPRKAKRKKSEKSEK